MIEPCLDDFDKRGLGGDTAISEREEDILNQNDTKDIRDLKFEAETLE
jgi:hypothetical protein